MTRIIITGIEGQDGTILTQILKMLLTVKMKIIILVAIIIINLMDLMKMLLKLRCII